jgi:hypothetical protein
MAETEWTLAELLKMLADDREKYNIPVDVGARYTMKFVVQKQDITLLEAIPIDVKEEILEWVRKYQRGEKLQMLSNKGLEDMTDEMARFTALLSSNQVGG